MLVCVCVCMCMHIRVCVCVFVDTPVSSRSFLFRCTAVAHLPPLKLSHGVLEFRPTWVGNTSAGYIDISNPLISKSSTLVISGLAPKRGSRRFSFSVPDNVPIEVTPMTGLVKPGQVI